MVVTGQQHIISNENGQLIYIIRVQVLRLFDTKSIYDYTNNDNNDYNEQYVSHKHHH